jgi:hypothetical protein
MALWSVVVLASDIGGSFALPPQNVPARGMFPDRRRSHALSRRVGAAPAWLA